MQPFDLRRVVQRLLRRRLRPPSRVRRLAGAVAPPPRLPASHQDAAQNLVEPLAFGSTAWKRWKPPDLDGVDPVFSEFVRALLKELQKRNLPFVAHEMTRDRERQNALFKQGVSRARWGASAHNFGMGADIVHYVRLWDLTPKEWAIVGLVGKEVARKRQIAIVWGGDWSFYDPAHWELVDWKVRKEIPLADRIESYRLRGLDGVNAKKPLKPRS